MDDRAQLLNDQQEAMRLMLEGNQVNLWTALPGVIVSVNFAAMTCEVQPTIQAVVEDQNGVLSPVTLPLLVDVPIHFPGGGGFVSTYPLAQGDEVLVVFSSRCIDAWWQSGGVQQAMESRMHDLSDGFAIPKVYSQPNVVPSISQHTAQFRNLAGTTYIEIDASGNINLVTGAGKNVTINGQAFATHEHLPGTLTSPSGAVTGETGAVT
jgi:Phage protein Gp138 N-terminal domain